MNAIESSHNNKRQRVDSTSEDDDDECHESWWNWTPSALSLQHKNIGESIRSPVYYSNKNNELQWRMLLFPRGCDSESRDYFSLFLELLTEPRDFVVNANFAFYLRTGKGLSHKLSKAHRFSADDRTCGFAKYLRRTDMRDGFNSVMCLVRAKKIYVDHNQSLTSSSNGNSSAVVDDDDDDDESMEDESAVYSLQLQQQRNHIFLASPESQDSRIKVATDLENAIDNGAFSDLVLIAGGKVFRAHRIILSMRSHVFASMLENNDESIELKDINDLILKEMLRFIYTGSVSAVTGNLMIAARTYGLEDLHLLCQKELARNISVQNAGNILKLADQAQGNKLKLYAMRFINCHGSEVIKTTAYKRLVDSHLHLIEELYRFEHTPANVSFGSSW